MNRRWASMTVHGEPRPRLRNTKTYSTGKPCARGHMSPRYASTGACVRCTRDGGIWSRLMRAARIEDHQAYTSRRNRVEILHDRLLQIPPTPAIFSGAAIVPQKGPCK